MDAGRFLCCFFSSFKVMLRIRDHHEVIRKEDQIRTMKGESSTNGSIKRLLFFLSSRRFVHQWWPTQYTHTYIYMQKWLLANMEVCQRCWWQVKLLEQHFSRQDSQTTNNNKNRVNSGQNATHVFKLFICSKWTGWRGVLFIFYAYITNAVYSI